MHKPQVIAHATQTNLQEPCTKDTSYKRKHTCKGEGRVPYTNNRKGFTHLESLRCWDREAILRSQTPISLATGSSLRSIQLHQINVLPYELLKQLVWQTPIPIPKQKSKSNWNLQEIQQRRTPTCHAEEHQHVLHSRPLPAGGAGGLVPR